MQLTAPLSPLSLRTVPRSILSEIARRFELTNHPDLAVVRAECERRERLREALEMRISMTRTLRQVGAA